MDKASDSRPQASFAVRIPPLHFADDVVIAIRVRNCLLRSWLLCFGLRSLLNEFGCSS